MIKWNIAQYAATCSANDSPKMVAGRPCSTQFSTVLQFNKIANAFGVLFNELLATVPLNYNFIFTRVYTRGNTINI